MMAFTLNEDSRHQIVMIKASCLLTMDIRKNILSTLALSLRNTGFIRVFIDLTESSFKDDEPMIGAIELATYMRSIGIPPETKLAFIYSDAKIQRKYFEKVANMGGYNIRYFTNPDEALLWLNP
jgi:hypothetical protein